MKRMTTLFALAMLTVAVYAQKKTTTSGIITFDATTPGDALPKAENKAAIAAIDTKTGAVAFESLVKNFSFTNERIQNHFNGPKWMDSEKFPKATFKGKITNLGAVNFTKDGSYKANVEGDLTMHGITKPVSAIATIVVNGGTLNTNSEFTVKLTDYALGNAGGKLADEPKITVVATFN